MLRCWKTCVLCLVTVLMGCSTPYGPPVLVHGGAPFPGLAGLMEENAGKQVDVLIVHGMCTNTRDMARERITALAAALRAQLDPDGAKAQALPSEMDGIGIETADYTFGKGTLRFTALVWSPLTKPLKDQLAYDQTGTPTDCSAVGECKPRRAGINGKLKDGLLNDCLADVLAYQGESKRVVRQKMANAMSRVIAGSEAQARSSGLVPGSFALVSTSLGSKITFDALEQMRQPGTSAAQAGAEEAAVKRLAIIFMLANQMPILGLADQTIAQSASAAASPTAEGDSLQRLLQRKAQVGQALTASDKNPWPRLSLVAFTDPNDLLSYRLMPSRYAVPGIDVADVLVSNDTTYFGQLELPNKAHTDYAKNRHVDRLIACGSAGSALCKPSTP